MKELKNIKNILFDCDGVLYSDLEGVFGQVSKKMTQYISNKLNVDLKEAKELQTNYFHKYNTSLNGLMIHHDIPPREFLEYVHDINLDFLEIVGGRFKPKFAAQAFFSKHRSQVHIKNEYPDEVKINNSMSPFTETVGLYFGGYRTDLDQENWKTFHTNYIQPLKHRRVIYKTPVSDSNIRLRGIVQVYLKDKENLFDTLPAISTLIK